MCSFFQLSMPVSMTTAAPSASVVQSLDPNLIHQIQQILMKNEENVGTVSALGIPNAGPSVNQGTMPLLQHGPPPGIIQEPKPSVVPSVINPTG